MFEEDNVYHTYAEPPGRDMQRFLRDWKTWVANGAVEDEVSCFCRCEGLCDALHSWCCRVYGVHATPKHSHMKIELKSLLQGEAYPFNADRAAYTKELNGDRAHLNTKRLIWVDEMLARCGK